MSSGVDAPIPPALLFCTRGRVLSASPSVAFFLERLLRAGWRERVSGCNLRARAWSAVDHTLSTRGVGVVLHGGYPQSTRCAFRIQGLAIVPHRKTQPTFPRRAEPHGD